MDTLGGGGRGGGKGGRGGREAKNIRLSSLYPFYRLRIFVLLRWRASAGGGPRTPRRRRRKLQYLRLPRDDAPPPPGHRGSQRFPPSESFPRSFFFLATPISRKAVPENKRDGRRPPCKGRRAKGRRAPPCTEGLLSRVFIALSRPRNERETVRVPTKK